MSLLGKIQKVKQKSLQPEDRVRIQIQTEFKKKSEGLGLN